MLAGIRRRLTYANAMATIAVFIALGGSSYAVATSSITSRQLKNNAIRSIDLKNNDIRGKDVRTGTLAGVDIKNDALTGADIRESSLQTVPSANTANRANAADTADRADLAANIAAPEGFHEIGATGEPGFNPGCANASVSPLLQSVGFYKDREGVVHLKGSYTCANPGATAFNLPSGYRPPSGKIEQQTAVCFDDINGNCSDDRTTPVQIAGAGVAMGGDGGVATTAITVLLDGVEFRAGG